MTKGHKFNKQYLPYGSTPDSDLLHFIMSHDTLTNKIGLSKIGVIHAKSCVHLAWNVPGVVFHLRAVPSVAATMFEALVCVERQSGQGTR